ncbi:hypothetical protein K435DRAFT_965259 [Dendrothele bispora CBS 962.96]|uniref:Uncharacterized protein n=1 Tax=Dendrothele bispora (strain CBS 962.96) TaxID=1314807 RepID=A0A4S8M6Z9_DENBC|nr:hypothetical protein K435DRAFT_965259 [Dendrothele bispora CBS 962.96]
MSILLKQLQNHQNHEQVIDTPSPSSDFGQLSSTPPVGSIIFDNSSNDPLGSLNFGSSLQSSFNDNVFSPAQLGVRSSQAMANELKTKSNLHGEYAANLDVFCAASSEERQLKTAAWMLELLMKLDNATKTQNETMSDKLQKDAREYAFYTLLSWKLSSYSGKVSDAVIHAMRDVGIRDVPPQNETALLRDLKTLINEKLTGDKSLLKKKIKDSLSPNSKYRNLALLTKNIIGNHNIPLTVELYIRIAFLRSVAVAIDMDPSHPGHRDGGKFWEEVDIALLDIRSAKNADNVTGTFIQLYQNDIKTFGAPENSGLKVAPALPHQKIIDTCATEVDTPSKVVKLWEKRLEDYREENSSRGDLNENGKRRRVDGTPTEDSEQASGSMVDQA